MHLFYNYLIQIMNLLSNEYFSCCVSWYRPGIWKYNEPSIRVSNRAKSIWCLLNLWSEFAFSGWPSIRKCRYAATDVPTKKKTMIVLWLYYISSFITLWTLGPHVWSYEIDNEDTHDKILMNIFLLTLNFIRKQLKYRQFVG